MSTNVHSDYLTTNDFAARFGVQAASVRRSLCEHGHYMGIRPIKLPNNRLLWSESEQNRILYPQPQA